MRIFQKTNWLIIISTLLSLISFFYPHCVFAQGYSKQDIRDLIDYFKEYDLRTRPFIIAQENRLNELIEQSYKDLKIHRGRQDLKKFIQDLYDELIALCNKLASQTENLYIRKGFYDPATVPLEFNKLNLEAAYLLLRIKLLGYLYQYKYKEMALKKDILCPFFYIYSTANKVKRCNEP
ncbi:MAG: hypothetical protein NC936_01335 [Candidatus Omnitrophica bacterium]|nr:hypothetical protein [Candidatus Omnitrophota bacterium]MCM8770497.1 hypothetical protein [Candidatus Omnitrophota bacterium]